MGINEIGPINDNNKHSKQQLDSITTDTSTPTSIYMEMDWAQKIKYEVESKMSPEELHKKNVKILKDLVDVADKINYDGAAGNTYFSWSETGEPIRSIHISIDDGYGNKKYTVNGYEYLSNNNNYKQISKLFDKLLKKAKSETD